MTERDSSGRLPRPASPLERGILIVITLMIAAVVVLAMVLALLRIRQIDQQHDFNQQKIEQARPWFAPPEPPDLPPDLPPDERAAVLFEAAGAALAEAQVALAEAQMLRASAEDASNSVDLILSFLEGATVLVGIAIGAAAYFGFRNYREIREETRSDREESREETRVERARIESALEKQTTVLQVMNNLERQINQQIIVQQEQQELLNTRFEEMGSFRTKIEHAQDIFSLLVQAYQEQRLGNYQEAYQAVISILDLDENNVQALYLAGWLENQYIPEKRELALARLEKAVQLSPKWPSARATLGVIQRRRAVTAVGAAQQKLYDEAIRNISHAMLDNPRLLDPNLESFWGPLAAIYRDREDYALAQEYYEKACSITPGSSYPAGNLAALYLRDSTVNGTDRARAIARFEQTLKLADAELANDPSDYFVQMDIAMSTIVLSDYAPQKYSLDEGCRVFRAALNSNPTQEVLSVTRRGLKFLVEACPDDWPNAKAKLIDLWHEVTGRIGDGAALLATSTTTPGPGV